MQNIHYVYTLLVASVISITLGYSAWKKRPSQGAVPLCVLLFSISFWAFFQALSFSEKSFVLKLFLANMRYFGIELAPIAFYSFAYSYKDRKSSINLKNWIIFLIFPLIMVILIWTNTYHKLFYTGIYLENGILILNNGLFFWINMLYLYVFIVFGIYSFFIAYLKFKSIYRTQTVIMAIASFIPVVTNLTFNFNFLPFKNIDITPLAFLITGILFFVAMTQYKLLDLVPVARENLFEEMDDAVIVLDSGHRILDLNKKARELIFTESELNNEVIGKDVITFLNNWKDLSDFITHSNESNKKIVNHSAYGPEYYYLRSSNFYYKPENRYGRLIVLRNITELEQSLLETRKAREEAEEANKAKSFFLANMSHEIRTPMNAVIGIAEILNNDDLTKEQQKKYTKIILDSSNTLLKIINDILDFSKIEAGKMELYKSSFNLEKLVRETVEIFSVLAANKSLYLSVKIDEKLNFNLLGDSFRIKQIMSNLIGNSIKFTETGYITVSVNQVKRDALDILINIIVSDSGIGIAEEKLDVIFESFKQADCSTTKKYGGTGLGLSIAKNLIELMGGKLIVESKVNEGSSFCCSIPLQIDAQQSDNTKQYNENSTVSESISGLKVLVVDDVNVNRQIIGIHLKKWGCKFDYAANGLEAVEKHENNNYDLILMDVQMPEMDGLEATEKIREKEKSIGKHITIIALTAGVMKEDIQRCINAGMDMYISKPIRSEVLYNMLLECAEN